MKNLDIRALSNEELSEKIASSEKNLQSLRFAHAISPIENPMQIKDLRRFIARMKTEQHTRVLNGLKEKAKSGDLTEENSREFLQSNNFESPVKLKTLKKVVAQHSV